MLIGSRIKEIRQKKGLSLSELALRAGVAKSYLSSIERNIQSNPSIQFLEKISEILNIDVQALIDANKKDKEGLSLDSEWIQIVKEAMESNVSKEQFRQFLEFTKWQRSQNNEKN